MRPRRTWLHHLPHVPVTVADLGLCNDLQLKQLAILIGAGVSVPSLSSLPIASQFLEAFYDACLPGDLDRGLFRSAEASSGPDARAEPRFEVVLDVVQQRFDTALRILDVYRKGSPNKNHYWLGELARRGALLITTNFDTLLERAGPGECLTRANPKDFVEAHVDQSSRLLGREIWHLHGILEDPRTGEDQSASIVASIRDCWASKELFRIDAAKGAALAAVLRERDLLILGYSGGDDFDIAPLLEEVASDRRLIWVVHCEDDTRDLQLLRLVKVMKLPDGATWYSAPCTNALATILDCGVRRPEFVRLVAADTGTLLRTLAGELCRNPEPDTKASPPSDKNEPVDLTKYFEAWRDEYLHYEGEQLLLAVHLCKVCGFRAKARSLLDDWRRRSETRTRPAGPEETRAAIELASIAADWLGLMPQLNQLPLAAITPPNVADFETQIHEEPALHAAYETAKGRQLLRAGQVEPAIECFRSSLEVRNRHPSIKDIEVAEFDLADGLFRRAYSIGDFDEAVHQAERALQSALSARHPEGVARSLFLLGRVEERLAELEWLKAPTSPEEWSCTRRIHLDKAKALYRRAIESAFRSADEELIAYMSGETGLFLWSECEVEDHPEAAQRLAEASRVHLREADWSAAITVTSALALCLERQGEKDRALLAHCEVYKAARRLGNDEALQVALAFVKRMTTNDEFVFTVARRLEANGVRI